MANSLTVPPGTVVNAEKVYPVNTAFLTSVMVGVTVTAVSGTSPTLQAFFEVLGGDGEYYTVWTSASVTAVGSLFGTVGPGESNGAVLSSQARLRFEVGGTTPSFTLSASVTSR